MAPAKRKPHSVVLKHGVEDLPGLHIDSYNLEFRDGETFLGDRASKKAFREILKKWRTVLPPDDDPWDARPSEEIRKRMLDEALTDDNPEVAALVVSVIEDFSQQLAFVIKRFLSGKAWRRTEAIVVGGGMRGSRIGELIIGRANLLLKADAIKVQLIPIANDPDDAGLIGTVHLAPPWIFEGRDSFLAIDIGGTNIRAGIVVLGSARDFSHAKVVKSWRWRHSEESPNRDEAVEELVKHLKKFVSYAKKRGLKLSPFVGVGCPGKINDDGLIKKGAQNLPGNWQSSRFNLPDYIKSEIRIGTHDTIVVMHNDAVVQGLSEIPRMHAFKRWGVLTMGTGLGNARFSIPLAPAPTAKEPKRSKAARKRK